MSETPQSEMIKLVENKPEIELKPQTLVPPPDEEVPDEEVTKPSVKKPKAKAAAPKKAKKAAVKAKTVVKARAAKKTKATKATKATSAKEPKSGQSGPPLDLTFDALNTNERKVMACFSLKGSRAPTTIVELAKEAFSPASKKKQNSWTRNSLRRLVRSALVEKLERGSYRITSKGRARMEKAS